MNNIVTQRFIKCHDKIREENRVRSSRQFAMSLDYLPQSLSEILKGRRDVTIKLLQKAVETYQINPVYIFTGEGPMFMSEDNKQDFKVLTIVTSVQDDERIVHVPAPAQNSYAAESHGANFIENLPNFSLPDYKYKAGTHRSFDVSGDSMTPLLREGDKVICNFLEPTLWESTLQDNLVYVVVTRADVFIRRIKNELKDQKQLLLLADNAFYDPMPVSHGDIRELWQVRSKISPFVPSHNQQLSQQQLLKELQALRKIVEQQQQTIENISQHFKG